MPAVFKQQMHGEFYLIQGFDQNLIGLTEPVFRKLFEVISAQNIADPLTRLLLRMILGSAHIVQVGRNGGFEIPEALFSFIDGDGEFIMIGQGEYFEIWAYEAWKKQEKELSDSVQNASRFSSLEICIKSSKRKRIGEK
jgi:division/cell wall cluster transcriptional repressor MraZ